MSCLRQQAQTNITFTYIQLLSSSSDSNSDKLLKRNEPGFDPELLTTERSDTASIATFKVCKSLISSNSSGNEPLGKLDQFKAQNTISPRWKVEEGPGEWSSKRTFNSTWIGRPSDDLSILPLNPLSTSRPSSYPSYDTDHLRVVKMRPSAPDSLALPILSQAAIKLQEARKVLCQRHNIKLEPISKDDSVKPKDQMIFEIQGTLKELDLMRRLRSHHRNRDRLKRMTRSSLAPLTEGMPVFQKTRWLYTENE